MKYRLNPVYGKELKTSVRSFRFALMVMIYNALLTAIALLGFEVVFNVNWNGILDFSGATKVYFLLICLEITMILFIIPANTAGSIAGEREKQTLEILLTTVLKPGQIIFGKLLSSISITVLLVISSLPVISIVFTIGGIGLSELMQFILVALVTAVFVGSIGILSSCLFRRTVRATVFSYGAILFFCVFTAAFALVAYLLQQMHYINVMHGVGTPVNVAWAALPMLLNPVVTVVNMVWSQYTGFDVLKGILEDMGGLPQFIENYWFGIGLVLQSVCAVLFLYLAQRRLNPLRKNRRRY